MLSVIFKPSYSLLLISFILFTFPAHPDAKGVQLISTPYHWWTLSTYQSDITSRHMWPSCFLCIFIGFLAIFKVVISITIKNGNVPLQPRHHVFINIQIENWRFYCRHIRYCLEQSRTEMLLHNQGTTSLFPSQYDGNYDNIQSLIQALLIVKYETKILHFAIILTQSLLIVKYETKILHFAITLTQSLLIVKYEIQILHLIRWNKLC